MDVLKLRNGYIRPLHTAKYDLCGFVANEFDLEK